MSKDMLRMAAALMVAAALIGCGGGQKPAEQAKKPAEPQFMVQVTTMDSALVASVAKMGPYAEVGKAVTELMTWIANGKITPAGGPFGTYMDDPTKVKPESTKYEVCIPVPKGTKSDKKAGIMVKMLPPMQVAWTEYMGPYDQVAPVYGKLYKWIADNKYEPAGPMVEFYLNDPSKTPAESLKARVGAVVKPMAPPPAADTTKKPEGAAKPAGEKPAKTGR
jgi:DNA gyrase inhibitor GyrI